MSAIQNKKPRRANVEAFKNVVQFPYRRTDEMNNTAKSTNAQVRPQIKLAGSHGTYTISPSTTQGQVLLDAINWISGALANIRIITNEMEGHEVLNPALVVSAMYGVQQTLDMAQSALLYAENFEVIV